MAPLDFLQKLRKLLIEDNKSVGSIEMTSGNYDDFGKPIKTDVPTMTTDLCEIGIFDDTLYFVVIVFSDKFRKTAFDQLKIFPNITIYGFKDFKKTLYPTPDFLYENFEKEILNDEFLQIQLNYKYNAENPQDILKEYRKIIDIIAISGLQAVSQIYK